MPEVITLLPDFLHLQRPLACLYRTRHPHAKEAPMLGLLLARTIAVAPSAELKAGSLRPGLTQALERMLVGKCRRPRSVTGSSMSSARG